MTNGFLTCWFLIPEQILWLDIPLIRLEVIFTFSIDFIVYLDTPIKYINNKFLTLANTYDSTGYFLGFTFLENVVLLAFSSHLSWFWIRKTQHKNTFWFLLGNWCSLNTVVKNLWKFFFERPAFLEEFQDEINSSKVSLHFNKTPNSLRQVLQTYYRHIQKYALFVHHKKKVLQKQSVKINLKEPGQSCGKSDGDVMKFIL